MQATTTRTRAKRPGPSKAAASRTAAAPRRKSAGTRRKPSASGGARRKKTSSIWISGGFDVPFLIIVLLLITIGLIMLFSASYTYSGYYKGDSLYYFKRQLIFAIFGIAVMFLVSRIDYGVFKVVAVPLLGITYILLILALVTPQPEGFEEFHRWIRLGPLSFQPSEVAKFSLVLFLAWHMDKHYVGNNPRELYNASWTEGINSRKSGIKIRTKWVSLILYCLVIGSMCVLVYMENHVSGTLLLFALGFMLMFLGGFNWKWFALIAGIFALVVIVVVKNPTILPEHAQPRITAWLDKNYDPRGVRWQTNQAIYAIGSGGFFGVGLGNSKMKQLYVSEPQNDFIFSIVCEELGFVGAFLIVCLFILLVWRGFVIGIHAKDKFGSLLCMGLVFQVGLQAALNIAVVTDVLPNTGISLPFFSYGGTALLMLIFEMGLILSVSRSARLKKS